MKVLICGEYGIYCRELISRLKKEKHDIFVITGSEKARREKPRSGVFQEYNFSYRSKNIGTIMKNVQADVLLIMGICDTKFTWQDINQESVRYLTSITNILMSAKEAGIKQVIYCSSLGIYDGCEDEVIDKDTDFEANSILMQTVIQTEYMCAEQNIPGEFEIRVIRYPEVYGDYKTHNCNICTRLMETFFTSTEMEIEAGRQHRVLYVNDAVDVLMRVFLCKEREKNYLIPGTVYTERQLIDAVKTVIPGRETRINEAVYKTIPLPGIEDPHLERLGIYEKYSLEDGLRELFKIYEKEKNLEIKEEKKKSVIKDKLIPLLENVGLFLLMTLLTYLLKDTWFGSIADLYLIYVVIIAVVYGCAHALFATLLTLLAKIGEILITGGAFDYAAFTGILQVLVIGVVVGHMRDKYRRKNGDLEDEKKYYQSELVDMTRIYDGNRYVKEIYEKRIVNYENSMVRVYEASSQLDFWEPQKVIFQAVDVARELMGIDDVAIYITGSNTGYLRLAAASSEEARQMGKSIHADENFFMGRQLVERTVYRNRDLESSLPSYACGIYDRENLNAIIMLWTKDLTKINLYESNMLALICRLIEASMNHAATYWNRLANQYIEGTNVLKEEEFDKMYQICQEGSKQNKLEYTALRVPGPYLQSRGAEGYTQIASLIRQTDIIGERDGDICILLMNTNEKEADYVIQRFQNAGVRVENGIG
ncbi:NAD(P)-dependent oxidoreductase [Eubacterium sp. am_0171]|uniref:NAD-dependent epimerase/dehydratase family protein n=1 Tax=unclassified Eubacterium (in: firmicutes) TaxID=2624479 RepID=UPI0010228B16|nr:MULTISPECIES: NAD(P)-dependent oxidoreductase [unclassified Eubacterium (in: firmicutes)]MSC83017.1 NAD-dependent epimerase/dehydratase family protein [Eubacterium sp. BIOML-A1]MSD04610.1 NAD-dependent epimerase/dehydratase family protein [Eubacterium sp. BIOML-A2]RYT25788.1 NAD(P)-dependent oxidoreductase [Eubacterium sp. am_0171]